MTMLIPNAIEKFKTGAVVCLCNDTTDSALEIYTKRDKGEDINTKIGHILGFASKDDVLLVEVQWHTNKVTCVKPNELYFL
jgi:hypothetical protein